MVVPSDGGRYSHAASAAPQDYPLGIDVSTGKEVNYPFRLDAWTISIIGMSRSEIRYYTPVVDLSNSPPVHWPSIWALSLMACRGRHAW